MRATVGRSVSTRQSREQGHSAFVDAAWLVGGAALGLATARFMGDRIAAYNGADYGFRVIAALGAIPALVSVITVPTVAAMERGEKIKGSTGRRVLYGLAGFSMVAGSAGFVFANPFQGVARHS